MAVIVRYKCVVCDIYEACMPWQRKPNHEHMHILAEKICNSIQSDQYIWRSVECYRPECKYYRGG